MELPDNRLHLKLRLISLIAMVMVVYVHAYTFELNGYAGAMSVTNTYNTFIQDLISQGSARVACPVFFMISGFYFFSGFRPEWQNIVQKYKRRFRSLFIPFIFWSAFGIGLYFILQLIPFSSAFFTNRIISQLTTEQLLLTLFVEPIPYQLWFLRDLMLLILISPAIWYLIKQLQLSALLVLFVPWLLDLDLYLFTSVAVFFFSAGCFLALHPAIINRISTYNTYLPYLLGWVGLLIFKTELHYLGLGNENTFLILSKIGILAGIVAVWLTINALVNKAGQNSHRWLNVAVSPFFIYAFHEPILTILKKGLFFLLQSDSDATTFLIYLVSPLLTIVLCAFTAKNLRKYAPAFFALITGDRDRRVSKPTIEHAPALIKANANAV